MKRNNVKRLLSTLTAIVLTVGSLAGCGNDAQGTVEQSSEAEKSTATSSEAEVASSEAEVVESIYPDYLNLDSAVPVVKDGEEITLTVLTCLNDGDAVGIDNRWCIEWIEEKMNINLEVEWCNYTQRTEPKNLMLASGEVPDLVIRMGVTNEEIVKYAEEGMFLPISDYFSEELTPNILAKLEEIPLIKSEFTTNDGKMYTLPLIDSKPSWGQEKVFVNMDYVKAAGWDHQPESVEELLAFAQDFKNLKPEDLGLEELYGAVSLTSSRIFEAYLRRAYGWISGNLYSPNWDNVEQEVVIPCLQDKFYDFIETMHTLYNEGFLHPDYYTMDDAEVNAIINAEQSIYHASWGGPLGLEDLKFQKYAAAHPLASEYQEEGISEIWEYVANMGLLVSGETEHPEAIVRLLDYMYSPEGSVMFRYGPQAGTDDTLGLVDGWVYDAETDTIDSSGNTGVTFSWWWCVDADAAELKAKEMSGVANPTITPKDPDVGGEYIYLTMAEVQGPHLVNSLPTTWMTPEQGEKLVDFQTIYKDFVTAELAKFVVGQRSLDEFEAFQDELMAMGGQDYLDFVAEVYGDVTVAPVAK